MNSLYKCSHSFYFESFHISEQLNQNSFRPINRQTEDNSEHFIGDRSQMVVVVAGGICKCSSFVSVSLYDQRYNLCPVVYSVPAQAIFTLAQSLIKFSNSENVGITFAHSFYLFVCVAPLPTSCVHICLTSRYHIH